MAGREKPQPVIAVRPLARHSEFAEAVRLQKLIWGFDEIELLPLRLFVVATKIGGQALGAYDGDRLIGFSLALPGLKPDARSYLHSHMLGVMKEYRDCGVGRRLKLEQRQDALLRGIDLIEWTFDPLEIKNAYFNVERLGAIARRFVLNQYGTSSSQLQGGLPTDRCIAEWWISTPRVETIVSGRKCERPPIVATVSIPADIQTIKETEPARARDIQKRVSERFLEHFSNGLVVAGFERTPENGTYLLASSSFQIWDSK